MQASFVAEYAIAGIPCLMWREFMYFCICAEDPPVFAVHAFREQDIETIAHSM